MSQMTFTSFLIKIEPDSKKIIAGSLHKRRSVEFVTKYKKIKSEFWLQSQETRTRKTRQKKDSRRVNQVLNFIFISLKLTKLVGCFVWLMSQSVPNVSVLY